MKNKKNALKGFAECIPVDGKPQMYEVKPLHTPTPWFVSENTLNDVPTQKTIWIDDMSGNAVFALPKMGGRTYESQMADAAFIVWAVNSHQEMRDVLVDLAHYVQDQIKGTPLSERVKRVITKAEGRRTEGSIVEGK